MNPVEFAVVGHPNKGKSSIVATLAENEQIAISRTPGTTTHADRHTFSIDEEALYTLIDTPGFQRARAVLDWLQAHAADASDRAEVVREFVRQHQADPRFRDEVELLRPITQGAGILYVVDGAKPYGAEFEVEMQILQWTGQPRMALINLIGEPRYVEQWRKALDQYFSIVREFDAVHADFGARIGVLRAFAELHEAWRPAMTRAVEALEEDRTHRLQRSAAEIADTLLEALTCSEAQVVSGSDDVPGIEAQLRRNLEHRIRLREQRARSVVQSYYRHEHMQADEASLRLLEMDLFTEEGWELFGLSRNQLLLTGSMTGALTGLGVDALAGGTTLLLGAGIGAVVGGLASWFGGDELAKVRVLGNALGGETVHVGPVTAANFPWVLLGRAWVHHQLVAERNHALRGAVSAAVADQEALMDAIPEELRKSIALVVRKIRDRGGSVELEDELRECVVQLLALPALMQDAPAPH